MKVAYLLFLEDLDSTRLEKKLIGVYEKKELLLDNINPLIESITREGFKNDIEGATGVHIKSEISKNISNFEDFLKVRTSSHSLTVDKMTMNVHSDKL